MFFGLSTLALDRGDIAALVFAGGIVPILIALIFSIIRNLTRGEFGLDIIAALSMTGALLANEMLAGAVVALMYSGRQLLESYAQWRAQREMTALLGRVARAAQVYHGNTLCEVLQNSKKVMIYEHRTSEDDI